MKFEVILASTHRGGIGVNNSLPWHLPVDLRRFKKITTDTNGDVYKNNAVIMGRKTWESLPEKVQPLPGRINIVISSNEDFQSQIRDNYGNRDVYVVVSFVDALRLASEHEQRIHRLYVIGGRRVFAEALEHPDCTIVYHTLVLPDVVCDTFVPMELIHRNFCIQEVESVFEDITYYQWLTYTRKTGEAFSAAVMTNGSPYSQNHHYVGEKGYLRLLHDILTTGQERTDRTGTGTYSIFCPPVLAFDLSEGFPLLTTKKVYWHGIVGELLWFLQPKRGLNTVKWLQANKIPIWDGNTTREFLDKRGLTAYEEGEVGPMYGFQLNHWGANYVPGRSDYTGEGINQISRLIEGIKADPYSRRHMLTTYNPADAPKGVLEVCHLGCQFYVDNAGRLSCKFYMRSTDWLLGMPFNLASYSLLTMIIAKSCNLGLGWIYYTGSDVHLYKTHVEQAKQQLTREPRQLPKVSIQEHASIEEYDFGSFELCNYKPHPAIKAPMAV